MNKKRRAEIDGVVASLNDIGLQLQTQLEIIQAIKADEHDALDNLPNHLRHNKHGEAMEVAISGLGWAAFDLESIDLDDIIGKLEQAKGGA